MGLWGTINPNIVEHGGILSISTTYTKIIKSGPLFKNFLQKDTLTGLHTHTDRGYHWFFEMLDYTYKYADPQAQYLNLVSFLGTEVDIKPHFDGNYIDDADGNPAPFLFVGLIPDYVTRVNFEDKFILRFESMCFVDYSQALA